MVSSERDVALFLGAGFSRDANLPLMAKFGPESERERGTLRKRHVGGNDPRKAARMLVDAGEVFSDLRDHCYETGALTEDEADNLETVFCLAEAMREAEARSVCLGGKSYDINDVVAQIQLWLWHMYRDFPPYDGTRPNCTGRVYQKFFDALKSLGLAKRTTVISTNYDLVFECFAWQQGMPSAYPDVGQELITVDGGTRTYLAKTDDPNAPLVCKLHGSVNFFHPKENEDCLKIAADVGGCVHLSGQVGNKPAILAIDAIWELRNKQGLLPSIIPPTYAKLTRHSWLRKIWNRAFKALHAARTIVFIGYSLPPSDGFMRALIQAALAQRSDQGRPLKVFVVDPGPEVRQRYCRLFGDRLCKTPVQTLQGLDSAELQRMVS